MGRRSDEPVKGGQGSTDDPRASFGIHETAMPDEPVKGDQGTTHDRRKGGKFSKVGGKDVADHDSLGGSGSGVAGGHKTTQRAGGHPVEGNALKQGTDRDYVTPRHFPHDPAAHDSIPGSGQTKDQTPFGTISKTVEQGVEGGASADEGALVAWGGMTRHTGYKKNTVGTVSIDRPGYPMDGEPTSKGHQPTDHVDD